MSRKSQKTAARRARLTVGRLAVEQARRQLEAEAAARHQADRDRREAEGDWAEKIGAPAFASIAEMVAALDVDRERLEELREARADYSRLTDLQEARDGYEFDPDANAAPDGPGFANDAEAWEGENPDDAEELKRLEAAGYKTDAEAWAGENPDDAEELSELEDAAGDCKDEDEARQRIEDDALSCEVRSGWTSPGDDMEAEDFCILLTTGGPAVRIRGELGAHNEPSRAWLEVQDWFKPWTEYLAADADTLLTYARVFCWDRD